MQTKTMSIIAAALIAAGCQSVPTRHPSIGAAAAAYDSAANDPIVARNARAELNQARDALARADAAWRERHDEAETSHLAYLARQRAQIAREVAASRDAEEQLQNASNERDRVRLQARERDAQLERQRAEAARQQAELARQQAQTSQQQAQQEAQRAEMARREAAAAQSQTAEERQRAAQLEAQLKDLSAKNTERGLVITLGDVLFDTGRAELRPGALRSVDRLADVLKQHPERRVMIEGFTDSQGSEDYNLALSERRANAVRAALVSRGVPPTRVQARPYGEAFPIASNDTAAGRQLNRRVEVVLSDAQGNIPSR